MTELKVFALKDSEGNYVGANSVSYDKQSGKNIYSYSEQLTNGYYTYTDKLDAEIKLKSLQDKGMKIKFVITFHIENIDILEVLRKENKMGNIKSCPFKHIEIRERTINSPMFDFNGTKSAIIDYRAMRKAGV